MQLDREFAVPVRTPLLGATLAFTALTLCGCYQADHPLLKSGEYADVAGIAQCQSPMDGKRLTLNITEAKSGFFSPTYSYTTDSKPSQTILFKKLGDNFYLAQIAEDGAYRFLYVVTPGKGEFDVLAPNPMNADTIDRMSKQHNLLFRTVANTDFSLMVGTDADQMAFLTQHRQSLLSTVMSCQR